MLKVISRSTFDLKAVLRYASRVGGPAVQRGHGSNSARKSDGYSTAASYGFPPSSINT